MRRLRVGARCKFRQKPQIVYVRHVVVSRQSAFSAVVPLPERLKMGGKRTLH